MQENILELILKIGSISGLLSLPFLIWEYYKKKSKLRFNFKSSHVNFVTDRKGQTFYQAEFQGLVLNQSIESNSIIEISGYIWEKGRTQTLGSIGNPEIIENKVAVALPLSIKGKEGKSLTIKFNNIISGTGMEKLLSETYKVSPDAILKIPKHEFKLVFKDVNENLFDDNGFIRSQKLINLWWTLPNTFEKLRSGNPVPYLRHMFKIMLSYIGYKIKSLVFIARF